MLLKPTTRIRLRTAAAVAAALAIGFAALPAAAQPDACAALIGKNFRKWAKTGQKNQDKCHKLANKLCLGSEAVCNDPDDLAFQIVDKHKYESTKLNGLAKIAEAGGACTTAPAVLGQFPGAVVGNSAEFVDDLIANRAETILGDANLDCDEAKVTCFSTISKQRAAVADKMLNTALKCQGDIAAPAPLSLACLDSSVIQSAVDKANLKINEECMGLTGDDVGTCEPLPECVTDAAVAEGQVAATRAFPNTNCGTVTGTRTASVSITTPTTLGGAQVVVNYPRFVMGIAGNGADAGVSAAISPGALAPDFFDGFDFDGALRITTQAFTPFGSGELVTVAFDSCRDLNLGQCAGDVARDCNAGSGCNICVGGSNPGAHCPGVACAGGGTCTGSEGPCNILNAVCSFSDFVVGCSNDPNDPAACPTGEACVAQQSLATCTVIDAADEFGNPVDGATCSVVLTEP